MSAPLDSIALDGISLLEASAGTGKTWTLAALFTRAVIVHRLQVPQIVAVTFTEAATQELRQRVRQWLQQARSLAMAGEDAASDREALPADEQLLRGWLRAARAEESLPALRLRLARAVRDLDLAVISTIHAFCQRLLAEHALLAGDALQPAELVPTTERDRVRLASDLWRRLGDEAAMAAFLRRTFGGVEGPAGLAARLKTLLQPLPLHPLAPPFERSLAHLQRTARDLRAAFATHGEQALADIAQAKSDRVLSRDKTKSVDEQAVRSWFAQDMLAATLPDGLRAMTPHGLRSLCLKGKQGHCPDSPLFQAMAAHVAAFDAHQMALLHRVRDTALMLDREHAQRLHRRDFDALIEGVHTALHDAELGPSLLHAVRGRHVLALVDEFQDTDARQWDIFRLLFGDAGLLLVGDPKQAIYRFRGADVHTYLAARGSAGQTHRLDRNFRSRPCLLASVDALFTHAAEADMGPGIAYHPVLPGGTVADTDLQWHGRAAPALVWQQVPAPDEDRAEWRSDDSLQLAARLCADALVQVLQAADGGLLHRRDGEGTRAVQPGDCAVLVRNNVQAMVMQAALRQRGVQAAASTRVSVFAGAQAAELLAVLHAVLQPQDEGRLRAALATRMLGQDAAAIAGLDQDSERLSLWQQRLRHWRERWTLHGPQAVVTDIAAMHAARLLAQADGERRLADWLHLGEAMQEAAAGIHSTQAQVDWLQAMMVNADHDDEHQQPRLESDAGRVRILTLHKSKGLEFPLVFLPFAGIGGRARGTGPFAQCRDDDGRQILRWHTPLDDPYSPSWTQARQQQIDMERQEDMRLLYVGLTRASHALWLCGGPLAMHRDSALGRLLGGTQPNATQHAALQGLVHACEAAPAGSVLAPRRPATAPPARTPQAMHWPDWRIHSFSQWHRQRDAQVDEAPSEDEWTPPSGDPPDPAQQRFAGIRFGNALHQALERVDFAAWHDRSADTIAGDQRLLLRQALLDHGYRDADAEIGLPLLAELVANTLNAPLPEGIRLCELPAHDRIVELEFHLVLQHADPAVLLETLHAHGIAVPRRQFEDGRSLHGMLTGKIDLVYRHAGRVYLLDYKSNRLAGYDPQTLAAAMSSSEYDLQAVLYAVALHRWQRLQAGQGGVDDRFAGARYLFCRGLSAQQPGQGIHCPALPPGLIRQVDTLFAPMPGVAP